MQVQSVDIGDRETRCVRLGARLPLVWMVGVRADRDLLGRAAEHLAKLSEKLCLPLLLRASGLLDPALGGPGREEGLRVLAWLRREFALPVAAEVGRIEDARAIAEVVDLLQIPPAACEQGALLMAAGRAGKPVHLTKPAQLSPEAMSGPVAELERSGQRAIALTDSGVSFGYNGCVADMTSIPTLQQLGYPVLFDAGARILTHRRTAEYPHAPSAESIAPLLRAAVAAGCNGVYLEAHPHPSDALWEVSAPFPLDRLEDLMLGVRDLAQLARERGWA